jgi:putative heme degradation protein
MALLWVVSVDLCTSLADLLRDHKRGMVFDDALDLRVFVARNQHEVVPLLHDPLVLGRPDVDRFDARGASTFAVEGLRRVDAVLLCALLDPFVDAAEDLLVFRCPIRKVHAVHSSSQCREWPAKRRGRSDRFMGMGEKGERDTRREQRIVENELLFRSLNERIEQLTESWQNATMAAVCECGDAECFAPIDLPLAEYERILRDRSSGRRFIVKPGHEIPDVEMLVERHVDYFVVEKPPEATEVARV